MKACPCLLMACRCMCREQQCWITQRMERSQAMQPPACLALLRQLVEADAFERFLALKFPGTKVCQNFKLAIGDRPGVFWRPRRCLELISGLCWGITALACTSVGMTRDMIAMPSAISQGSLPQACQQDLSLTKCGT